MKRNVLPRDFSFFSPITFLDVETRPSRRAEGRKEGRDRGWILLLPPISFRKGCYELETSQEGNSTGCVTGRLSIHYPFC